MNYTITSFGLPKLPLLAGGTVGGGGIWNKDFTAITPEAQAASRARGKKGIKVLPSGAGSKQELRYLRDEAERGGYDWTEAPIKAELRTDQKGNKRYVDPATGKSVGTFMWTGGGYGGRMEREDPEPQPPSGITQDPSLTQATELRETMVGPTGQPMAFTGFGQMARNQKADQYQAPIGEGISSMPSNSPTLAAAGVPRFPFAGAESAFERATRTTTAGTNVGMPTAAFGDMPMFPSSRFGGPQPAQTMGPLDTQSRRPWMY